MAATRRKQTRGADLTLQLEHRALYAAFDRFPSSKGAAQRIRRLSAALFEAAGGGVLFTLGDEALPLYQRLSPHPAGCPEGEVEEGIERCRGTVEVLRFGGGRGLDGLPNLLDRGLAFGARLAQVMATQPRLEACQFRDPWSGLPILTCPRRARVAIYEINGLPSIELADAYPRLPASLRRRLRAAEELCWTAADWVLTPSRTMRDNLIALGVPAEKIRIGSNGARVAGTEAGPGRPAEAPARYLLYFGALQGWQGVDVLLRAFGLLRDFEDLGLVVCASARTRRARALERLAEHVAPGRRVVWRFGLGDAELAPWVAHAELSVAPLTECPRNLEQGCLPLKILESMAAGVPVVASDLPAVREVIDDGVDGRLVRPDRPSELARALRLLLESPAERQAMSESGRRKVGARYGWQHVLEELRPWYAALLEGPETAVGPRAVGPPAPEQRRLA
jgi:glycosyltransferase involved in cell wall biosynthesis